MDPAQKKWLSNLLEHIYENFNESIEDNSFILQDIDSDEFLFKLLHKTGFAFGFIEKTLFKPHPLAHEWNTFDRAKIGFTESLLACYLYFNQKTLCESRELKIRELLNEAIRLIGKFYEHYDVFTQGQTFPYISKYLNSEETTINKVEGILDNRIKVSNTFDIHFRYGSVFNSFIFLDIIFFCEMLKNNNSTLPATDSRIQQEILKAIAFSIHNINRDKDERKKELILYNYFLASTIHHNEIKKLDFINDYTINIDSFYYNESYPKIINILIFEYSIFTMQFDGIISDTENEHIMQMAERLRISQEQKEMSLIIISSFIMRNFNSVSYLRNNHTFDIIRQNLYQRISSILTKNKGKIIREIEDSKELAELLWKAKNTELTEEERSKVKIYLSDIFLRTIPSLAIFMIPGGAIILPILLKIIPEEILIPTPFRNK